MDCPSTATTAKTTRDRCFAALHGMQVPLLVLAALVAMAIFAQAADATPAAVAVSGQGGYHCVLFDSGNVTCWGGLRQSDGSATFHAANNYTGGDAIALSGGINHYCVLKRGGNVHCIGDTYHGQTADYNGGDATAVSASWDHTCVLKSNGNMHCWGLNQEGNANDYLGGDAVSISAGGRHTCLVRSNGGVFCQGNNTSGMSSGYGGIGVPALAVSAGYWHTCVLQATHNVYCFGSNDHGATDGYQGGDATAIETGTSRTCVLKSGGDVKCMGVLPYQTSQGDIRAVSLGYNHDCWKLVTGDIHCWGTHDGESMDYALPAPPNSVQVTHETPGISLRVTAVTYAYPSDVDPYELGFKGYRYLRSSSSTGPFQAVAACPGVVSGCLDSGVAEGTTYYYAAIGVNMYGDGPTGTARGNATTYAHPSAPYDLNSTAQPGAISLTWHKPTSDGGSALVKYNVYWVMDDGTRVLLTGGYGSCGQVYASGDRSGCVDRMAGNVTRRYQVTAVSGVFESAYSSLLTGRSGPEAPSAPRNVAAASSLTDQRVRLTWQPPGYNGGEAVHYEVYRCTRGQYLDPSSCTPTYFAGTGTTTSFDDSNCPVLDYCDYQVYAINSAGRNWASTSAEGTSVTL